MYPMQWTVLIVRILEYLFIFCRSVLTCTSIVFVAQQMLQSQTSWRICVLVKTRPICVRKYTMSENSLFRKIISRFLIVNFRVSVSRRNILYSITSAFMFLIIQDFSILTNSFYGSFWLRSSCSLFKVLNLLLFIYQQVCDTLYVTKQLSKPYFYGGQKTFL